MTLRAMAINACVLMSSALVAHEAAAQADLLELEEASIKKTHDAIRSGATTCADVSTARGVTATSFPCPTGLGRRNAGRVTQQCRIADR